MCRFLDLINCPKKQNSTDDQQIVKFRLFFFLLLEVHSCQNQPVIPTRRCHLKNMEMHFLYLDVKIVPDLVLKYGCHRKPEQPFSKHRYAKAIAMPYLLFLFLTIFSTF